MYPAATELLRLLKKDDVLPLSKPVIGVSGKVYKELPIPARKGITISTVGYNMYVRSAHILLGRVTGVEIRLTVFSGTRTFGDQTPMSSDRSDGSTRTRSLKRLLESMAICA